ncbi:MAG: helix-turn-helix domain-containing protein, partial [Halobacteriota archaeon]
MSHRSDTLQFLSNSPHRVEILRTLRGDGGLSRRDLYSAIQASRRTVKRSLQKFDERGWIHERDGEITLSVGGAFVLDGYEDFADR